MDILSTTGYTLNKDAFIDYTLCAVFNFGDEACYGYKGNKTCNRH